MNRQSGADDIVVVGDNETSRLFQVYPELTLAESLLNARDRAWSDEQSKNAATGRFAELVQIHESALWNGRSQVSQCTVLAFPPRLIKNPFARPEYHRDSQNRERYGVTKFSRGISLSVKATRGSTSCPRWLTDPSAPFALSYLSLASDTSIHGELSSSSANSPAFRISLCPPLDSSSELATNAVEPSTQESEPLVLASVRQVLAKSPSYAEEVVLALKKLPDIKRDVLFNQYRAPVQDDASTTTLSPSDTPTPEIRPHPSTTDLETWKEFRATTTAGGFFESTKIHPGVSGTNHAPANASGSPRQVPSGQSSEAKGGKKQSEKYRVQKPSGSKSKKKTKLPDDGGDNQGDGGDGFGFGGGGGGYAPTDRQRKSDIRWACPYCLVFAHMLQIARFKTCRAPGSLNSRSLWKDHIKEYHSPKARPSNPVAAHASFYMDEEQWVAVQARIADASSRPRSYDDWFEVQKKCFLDVWRIIFPKTRFPNLNEPLSPFHPDSSLLANLEPQSRILLEAIRNVRARRAVSTSSIATVQDFCPTGEENMQMVAEAVAIVANMSPSTSQWLANVSPEGLQAAVADHDQATHGPEAGNANPEAVTSPEPTSEPSPESSPSHDPTGPAAAVIPTLVALDLYGTQIILEVAPNSAIEPHQRQAILHVIPPPGFNVNSMRRLPIPPPALPAAPGLAAPASAPTFPWPAEPDLTDQCIDPSLIEAAQGDPMDVEAYR